MGVFSRACPHLWVSLVGPSASWCQPDMHDIHDIQYVYIYNIHMIYMLILLVPTWYPFIAWIAAWAASFVVKETNPEIFFLQFLMFYMGGEWLTKALGEVGLLVNEHLGWDNGAKWLECLTEVRVGELLSRETRLRKGIISSTWGRW